MRVVGVPMVNRNPLETRPEVVLHLSYQVAREVTQIFELHRIFGRHNEAELVTISPASLLECIDVGSVVSRAVRLSRLPVPAHAITDDVAQMHGHRSRAGLLEYDEPSFDDNAACLRALVRIHELRRHLTATASSAPTASACQPPPGSASELADLHLHARQKAAFNRSVGALRRSWFHAKHVVTAIAHRFHPITIHITYCNTARANASTGAAFHKSAAR